MRALLIRRTLPDHIDNAREDVARLRGVCREAVRSPALKGLLAALLANGNFVNGGTPRSGAAGVHVDALWLVRKCPGAVCARRSSPHAGATPPGPWALTQACQVKSTDGSTTLLRTIASMRRPMTTTARQLLDDLPSLRTACQRADTLPELKAAVEACRTAVNTVRQELALCPVQPMELDIDQSLRGTPDTRQGIKVVLQGFVASVEDAVSGLESDVQALGEDAARLLVFFGEDAEQGDVDEVVRVLRASLDHLVSGVQGGLPDGDTTGSVTETAAGPPAVVPAVGAVRPT